MLKKWSILVGLSAALAMSASAFAGGEECASKQNRVEKAAPATEKTAAQSEGATGENKQDVAVNCPGGRCEK